MLTLWNTEIRNGVVEMETDFRKSEEDKANLNEGSGACNTICGVEKDFQIFNRVYSVTSARLKEIVSNSTEKNVIVSNSTEQNVIGIPLALARSLLRDEDSEKVEYNVALKRVCRVSPLWTLLEEIHSLDPIGLCENRSNQFCPPGVEEMLPCLQSLLINTEEVYRGLVELVKCCDSMVDHSFVKAQVDDLFKTLSKPGVLFFLGHRSTVGSTDTFCPPVSVLQKSFNQPLREGASLTVGGRAFTKHCQRDTSFWPAFGGTDSDKNKMGEDMVNLFLSSAVWVNVHVVPSGKKTHQPIVEIRQLDGHGARWSADGTSFRGFLEPLSPYFKSGALRQDSAEGESD